MIKATEKQLAFLVTVTTSLFSYGMPSANSKLSGSSLYSKIILGDMDDMSGGESGATQEQSYDQKYPDFVICSRVIYLSRITNQLVSVRKDDFIYFIYSKTRRRYIRILKLAYFNLE